ncbi:hypothetical protein GGER_31380 [Serratia rubidaea]
MLNRNKNAAADLPELGGSTVLENAREKEWATKAKSFGENSNLNKVSREQLRARAENYAIGQATGLLQQQAQDLLSPLGTANVSLALTADGDFAGSKGQLFSPLYDVNGLLTYSQLGFQQRTDSSLANLGLGQRWISGDWLLGYNTVFDSDLENQRNRASVGAEAWGIICVFPPTITSRCRRCVSSRATASSSAVPRAAMTLPPRATCRFTASLAPR